jgi:hypothetical protein
MKKQKRSPTRRAKRTTMRAEYDFTAGTRGKYAAAYATGTNLVLLAPDVAEHFRSATAVNKALREYLKGRPRKK